MTPPTRSRRGRKFLLIGAAGALALGGLAAVPAVNAMAAGGCQVTYAANSWNNGFSTNITVKNLGDAITNGWRLEFDYTAGQQLTQVWGGSVSQTGTHVTITNESWNGSIPTNGSVTPGGNGTHSGQNPNPTSFTLNGVTCTGSVIGSPSASPSRQQSASPTASPTRAPSSPPPTGRTPLAINGQLHVCGVNLCNQFNRPIQLRGASTHGLQWFAKCYNTASLDALANDWKADLLRIAMYVQEEGYETNPAGFTSQVNNLVDQAESRGMYAIVDFHTLTPGDPNYNLNNAKTFFANVASRNANKKNIIYEIANEPNGVSWQQIKTYAEQVIPVIRAADPDAVIIVGTRGWSSLGVSNGANADEIIASPVNATNIMYTFHFYAASHKDNYRAEVSRASSLLPLFVTEWGTVSATGGGAVDIASSTAWLDLLDSKKISYANWTYSDANESSAAFKAGTCNGSNYAGTGVLNESGVFVRSRVMTADNFPTG
jgi:endoglucanase